MNERTQYIADLLKKHLEGKLTAGEQADLEKWVASDRRNRQLFERLADSAELLSELRSYYDINDTRISDKISAAFPLFPGKIPATPAAVTDPYQRLAGSHRPHKLLSWRRLLPYAASFFLLLTMLAALWFLDRSPDPASVRDPVMANLSQDILPGHDRAVLVLGNGEKVYLDSSAGNIIQRDGFQAVNMDGRLAYSDNEAKVEEHCLSTPRGGQYHLTLPDGTLVWLNAASSIRFPTVFSKKERRVTITGEAYFEVVEDKQSPFSVIASGAEVQVLGTRFNINAYAEEGSVKATLVQGRVKVRQDSISSAVTLTPGQQAEITIPSNTSSRRMSVNPEADIEKILAWKNGFFNFEGAGLEEVMRQLARWYDLKVVYGHRVPDVEFGGELSRNVPLSEVLRALRDMKIQFKMEGNTLTVMNH